MDEEFRCECGRVFGSKNSLRSHYRFCSIPRLNQKQKKVSIHKISDNLYRCECGREFNNYQSLNAHFTHCGIHCEKIGRTLNKRKHEVEHKMCGWDKFKEDDLRKIKEKSQKTQKEAIEKGLYKSWWETATTERVKLKKQHLSKIASERREKSDIACKGTEGYYKGIHCDSSWELAFVIYCMDHSIPIERCKKRFQYTYDDGSEHTYTPDFIINGSEIIEIKGYSDSKWKNKLRCCVDRNIRVLYKEDMRPYLSYVRYTYGSKFTEMYEQMVNEE